MESHILLYRFWKLSMIAERFVISIVSPAWVVEIVVTLFDLLLGDI
jgi:hypothetical protein